jgi:hypothetical protein
MARTLPQVRKVTNPLEMPLRVDLFGNGIVYELWSWIEHFGGTVRHGHNVAVTRHAYPTCESPPMFSAFNDAVCTIVGQEACTHRSDQAALAFYVRDDVAKQVCSTPTAIQFQYHIQKIYLFVRPSMMLVTCLM